MVPDYIERNHKKYLTQSNETNLSNHPQISNEPSAKPPMTLDKFPVDGAAELLIFQFTKSKKENLIIYLEDDFLSFFLDYSWLL